MNTKDKKIIKAIKIKYNKNLNEIKKMYKMETKSFNLNRFRNCMDYQEKVIFNIIKDVINEFNELNLSDFIIVNGSYARSTNIFGSDLDFNILYDDRYKDDLFSIEMRISFILSKILNFRGCDRIHSIMVYTPLISNNKIDFDGINLIFDNKKIPFYFREEYEVLLYETYNSSRNYKILLNHFTHEILKNNICNEWTNNFLLIKDFGKYIDFKNSIKLYDQSIQNRDDFNLLINNEINKLLLQIKKQKYINNINTIKIKDLKEIYKSNPTKIIYKFLAIISRIFNYSTINIKKLHKNKLINSEIYNSIHHYLFYICRIQLILDSMNLDLSSHSTKIIDCSNLNEQYYKTYSENIFESTNEIIKMLYKNIKEYLIEMSEELNERLIS